MGTLLKTLLALALSASAVFSTPSNPGSTPPSPICLHELMVEAARGSSLPVFEGSLRGRYLFPLLLLKRITEITGLSAADAAPLVFTHSGMLALLAYVQSYPDLNFITSQLARTLPKNHPKKTEMASVLQTLAKDGEIRHKILELYFIHKKILDLKGFNQGEVFDDLLLNPFLIPVLFGYTTHYDPESTPTCEKYAFPRIYPEGYLVTLLKQLQKQRAEEPSLVDQIRTYFPDGLPTPTDPETALIYALRANNTFNFAMKRFVSAIHKHFGKILLVSLADGTATTLSEWILNSSTDAQAKIIFNYCIKFFTKGSNELGIKYAQVLVESLKKYFALDPNVLSLLITIFNQSTLDPDIRQLIWSEYLSRSSNVAKMPPEYYFLFTFNADYAAFRGKVQNLEVVKAIIEHGPFAPKRILEINTEGMNATLILSNYLNIPFTVLTPNGTPANLVRNSKTPNNVRFAEGDLGEIKDDYSVIFNFNGFGRRTHSLSVSPSNYLQKVYKKLEDGGFFIYMVDEEQESVFTQTALTNAGFKVLRWREPRNLNENIRKIIIPNASSKLGKMHLYVARKGKETNIPSSKLFFIILE